MQAFDDEQPASVVEAAAAWVVRVAAAEFDQGQQQRRRGGFVLAASSRAAMSGGGGGLDQAGDGELGVQDVEDAEVDGVGQDSGLQGDGRSRGQQQTNGGDSRRCGR